MSDIKSLVKKICVFVSVSLITQPVMAEKTLRFVPITPTYFFSCEGVTTGNSISDSFHSFDIQIETSPPNLIGPGLLWFCSMEIGTTDSKATSDCEITETEMKCECQGGTLVTKSLHKFSRLSGDLTFFSVLKDDIFEGRYKCRPIKEKLF